VKWLQVRQPSAFQDLPAEVQGLLAKMREHFPKADLDVIRDAYQFAAEAHHAQTRASGEPYINHSVTVASTLVDLRLDPVTIAAALLHDVAEDTGISLSEVQDRFGVEMPDDRKPLPTPPEKPARRDWRPPPAPPHTRRGSAAS